MKLKNRGKKRLKAKWKPTPISPRSALINVASMNQQTHTKNYERDILD